MKSMVVYSSKTGNTRKIGESIFEILPEPKAIYAVEQAPPPFGYDFIAIGCWADKGMPDSAAAAYMQNIQNTNVGIFITLGAYPDSEHAQQVMCKAKALLKNNNIVVDYMCQGKVAAELIQWMEKITITHPDHVHAMNEERRARLAEAQKHPDVKDCQKAQWLFSEAVKRLKSGKNRD